MNSLSSRFPYTLLRTTPMPRATALFLAFATTFSAPCLAQAWGRAGTPEIAAAREAQLNGTKVYQEGELTMSVLDDLLTPDANEGGKGYMPSGKWVNIAQEDLDSCFGTANIRATEQRGAASKNWGAAVGTDKLVSLNFVYVNNAHTLSSKGLAEVALIARKLKDPALKGRRFVIEGHANATGSAAANRDVTCRRAAYVRERLRVDHGIAADALMAVGLGASQPLQGPHPTTGLPIAPADDINRRVVVRLLAQQ